MKVEEENKQLWKLVEEIEGTITRFKAFKITVDDIDYTFQEWMAIRTEEIRGGNNKSLIKESDFSVLVIDLSKLKELGVPGGNYTYQDEAEKQALDEWIFFAQNKKITQDIQPFLDDLRNEELEQEIARVWETLNDSFVYQLHWEDFRKAAIHFANWRKEHEG